MRRVNMPLRAALGVLVAVLANSAHARHGKPPYSLVSPARLARVVPIEDVATIDAALRREQADAKQRNSAWPTKRMAVADGIAVTIGSDRNGTWDTLPDGSRLWRVNVRALGATDLRLGFARFGPPTGATLYLIGADNSYQGPYTADDAGPGGFDSPVVPGDRATIELRIPAGADTSGALELTRVGAGFRDVSKQTQDAGPGTSGACNIDVACPLGQAYPDDVRAVAYYEFVADDDHGSYICSGSLLADVPRDRRNYFLTAAHCVSSASEANSMVVYWNYQSTVCGALVAPPGGYFNDDQHGASLRATRADADFALVELSQAPDPAWNVYYAGWDASGAMPSGTIGIHHPSGDVKKITAGPAPGTTNNCIGTGGASANTHWETGPYSQGTTEGGSSGSGLFVKAGNGSGRDRLLIGTLSGGLAACSESNPTQPNNETDCYGKLASAWNGPSASTRLRDWLDPANTGALTGAGVDSHTTVTDIRRFGHSRHQRPAKPTAAQD